MPDLAWINGEISALEEAKVSFLDHGYFFGYGVYEAMKVYDGRLFAVQEHLERFERSMKEIRIEPDFTREELINNINDLVKQSCLKSAIVYFQITRGVGRRIHGALKNTKPSLTMFISYLPPVPEEYRNNGAKAVILPDDRWAYPFIKSLNLLPNVLAKQIAEENDAYEAILVRGNGYISEAASSNVFAVIDDTIVTPPTDGKILAGISRMVVLKLAEKYGLKFKEDYFTADQLRNAQEVFITNTGSEVLPITNIDGNPVGNGRPGPATQKIYQLFQQEIKEYFNKNQ